MSVISARPSEGLESEDCRGWGYSEQDRYKERGTRGGDSVKCIWGFSDAVISRMDEGWRKMKRMRGELLEKLIYEGFRLRFNKTRIWKFKRVSAPIKSFWAVWLDGVRLKHVTLYLYYLGEHCQSGGTSGPLTHPDPMGLTQQAVQNLEPTGEGSAQC